MKKGAVKFFTLGKLGNGTVSQAILIFCAIAIWTEYLLSAVILAVISGVIWFNKSERAKILENKTLFYLTIAVFIASLLPSLISGNLIGIGISCDLFLILSIGSYLLSTTDKEGYDKFAFVSCVLSISAFIYAVVQDKIIYNYSDEYRPTAGAFNANYYGALIVMVIIVAILKITEKEEETETKRPWYNPPKIFYLITVILNLFALFLCESRSALLSLMACLGLLLLLKKHYVILGIGAAFAVGIWTVGWFYPDIFSWTNSLSFIIGQRMEIWKCALKSFASSPLNMIIGRGPMTYYMVWEQEGLYGANHAHNILVDSLINVGILGTVIYAAIIIYFVVRAFKAKKDVMIPVLLFVCQVIVQGVADVAIMWHQSAVFFLVICSLLSKQYKTEQK